MFFIVILFPYRAMRKMIRFFAFFASFAGEKTPNKKVLSDFFIATLHTLLQQFLSME